MTTFGTALFLPLLATGSVDIEALRLFVEDGDRPHLVLAYQTHGDPTVLRGVLLDVAVGEGEQPRRYRYRLREAQVPQREHHFHMPLDPATIDLPKGRHRLEAWIDSAEAVAETNEENNRAILYLDRGGEAPGPGSGSQPEATALRIGPFFHKSVIAEGRASWVAPLEAGFHPAYGSSEAILMFRHPALAGVVGKASLHLAATEVGRPLERLGPLRITVRSLPQRRPECREEASTVEEFADLREILFEVPGEAPCAGALELRLALPAPPDPEAASGALLQIDPEASWLLFGGSGVEP